MAERTKFWSYVIFSAVMCAFIYPVIVHWTWGGGLIADININGAVFSDFAGSGIVHMTGGIAAFMGALFLGPRIGRYAEDGTPRAIPGHNIPFAILGVFILWVGWFGFNPGSELLADEFVSTIAVNTMLAAVAAGFVCAITITLVAGKPDLAMIGNGVLAGLVAITAPCGAVTPLMSVLIGAVAGALVVGSVLFFDKIKIDDPVGAISVHGVCGLWGLLSIGLFATYDDAFLGREDAGLFYGGGIDQLVVQLLMVRHHPRLGRRLHRHPVRRPQGHDRPARQPRGRDRGPRRPRARPAGLRRRHGALELISSSNDRPTKEPTHETRHSGHQAVQAR